MPLTYRIFPELGLVHVRYVGLIDFAETAEVMARYMADPAYRPAQKQCVDLSRATALDTRFVQMLAHHARALSIVTPSAETLLAYYAPTPLAFSLARTGFNSWTEVPGVVARIFEHEGALMSFLGLTGDSLAAILETTT
jgi:hypothetical protein